MSHVSLHTSSDDWQREAVRLANIITKGPGTPHARIDKVRKALIEIAAENYTAGKAEAMKAAPVDETQP